MMALMQIRVARPTRDLERVSAFYRDAVGLRVLSSFADHEGYSGVILGIPDAAHQLELVRHAEVDRTTLSSGVLTHASIGGHPCYP